MKIFKILYNHLLLMPAHWISFVVPKQKNLWIFDALTSKNFTDNSKFLFLHVIKHHPEIDAVWLTRSDIVLAKIREQGWRVERADSIRGYLLSLRAACAFYTHDFRVSLNRYGLSKRTTLVNLWHGAPIKVVLRPAYYWLVEAPRNILRNRFSDRNSSFSQRLFAFAVYFRNCLFAAPECTMCIALAEPDANILKNRLCTSCAITGFPRNDILLSKNNSRESVGINDRLARIITYLPTHRSFRKGTSDPINFFSFGFDESALSNTLERHNAYLLIKLHHIDQQLVARDERFSKRIIFVNGDSPDFDVCDLLADTDILITDYSSVYFDFLLTQKPIIFASFDLEEYAKDPGFYYDYAAVTPGPKVNNWKQLDVCLNKYLSDPLIDGTPRRSALHEFHKYADFNSSERVFQEVLKLNK